MRIRRVRYSSHFLRALKKLPPELKEAVREREALFRENCFDPHLATHKLSGKLKDFWSFSITHKHRILFAFAPGDTVDFIDVDDHSIYR